ncbi:MAG: TfoX/Sxy family protein [Candidatus Latescibacteria bacterium]|jgi:TfoX/Sxy family transcriptional regulator of competence genes|nr:TfoX/Sxy family protein [Candidatus Latescibacterota bacterium]
MAYDEDLAGRVRDAHEGTDGLDEKKMFGGICFLHHGNMCCGITGDDLIVRVGPDNHEDALGEPNTKVFDITGSF